MRGLFDIRMLGALLASAVPLIAPAPAAAQGSYSPYNETPAAALARYVHILADNPQDFASLIGAGRSALALGDTQAAAGFFARADEVDPKSPLPQAGMGAVSVANGEPQAALPYFRRAQQLGAPATNFACDRGLAYDLLGQQAQAQADYRAALAGADVDEARRRLALSLAISGNQSGALEALAPLLASGDVGAKRVRAFVLALTGDSNGAMVAIDSAMPGSWARVSPFLQRLPGLKPGEKAAAVNLGIFPDSNGTPAYAYAAPASAVSSPTTQVASVSTDRLVGIDALLHGSTPTPQAASQPTWQPAPQAEPTYAPKPTQVAYASVPTAAAVQQATASFPQPRRIWLQLASGRDADALPAQFERLKAHDRELFHGITGYVAKGPDRVRLLIGPFHDTNDADIFAEDLQADNVQAFKWSNSESDEIVPLGRE